LKELERENGYVEAPFGMLRDELLNGEIFYTLQEAKVLIELPHTYAFASAPTSLLNYPDVALQ
jgi:hypothetical protein